MNAHSDLEIVRQALTSWHMQTPTMMKMNAQKAREALKRLEEQLEALQRRYYELETKYAASYVDTSAVWNPASGLDS